MDKSLILILSKACEESCRGILTYTFKLDVVFFLFPPPPQDKNNFHGSGRRTPAINIVFFLINVLCACVKCSGLLMRTSNRMGSRKETAYEIAAAGRLGEAKANSILEMALLKKELNVSPCI